MNFKPALSVLYNNGSRVIFTFIVSVLLLAAIFTLSLFIPFGYAVWLMYTIPLVYVSIVIKKPMFTYLVLILAIVFIITEYLLGRPNPNPSIGAFNRILGIGVFIYLSYILNYKKLLEKRLVESEDLFRITFEQAGSGIVHIDTEGHWVRINDKFCDIVGRTRGELLHLKPSDIVHPDDLKAELRNRGKLLEGEISDYKMEKRYIRSDLSIAWTIFTCTIHQTQSNRIFYVGVVEDITQRKLAEEEIKNSERLLKQILNVIPVGIWFMDGKGDIIDSNPKAKEIWAGDKQVGIDDYGEFKGWYADTEKRIGSRDWASARAVEYGEISINEIINIECFDASRKIILNSAIPLFDNNEKIIGAIAVNQDITELKKVEEQLKISEEKFRTIAETMPLMVWTAKPSGELDYVNQWGLDYTGKCLDEIGDSWNRLKLLNPDKASLSVQLWKESMETGKVFEDTSLLRRNDGQYRWFLSRAAALKDRNGSVIKWFGTSTDIHDQKEAEEKLKETLEKLERSNKELEQFAYVASHDLKEPLRMITNYMQLFEKNYKGKLDERADTYIGFAVDGAMRMNSLINDLLIYSRVSSKPREIDLVDLNVVVEDVERDLQLSIDESRAVINCTGLPHVMADCLQMRQLFQNLIQNAMKFRDNNHPVIDVSSEKIGEEWLFKIKDNGIGIDPEFKDRIFVIFQRLHEREKYPGTGIGLAICKKIVEHHGGRIWVESEPGGGSEFCFTLPAEI
ncbi:MAG: PAS domain S-box protein [Syntrophomonadaceae bacterium]